MVTFRDKKSCGNKPFMVTLVLRDHYGCIDFMIFKGLLSMDFSVVKWLNQE